MFDPAVIDNIVYLKFIPFWIINTVKISFIGFFVIGVVFLVFLFAKSSWAKFMVYDEANMFSNYRSYGLQKITKAWEKIVKRLSSNLNSEYKLAIIEADDLLNNILKKMGYSGETMGDRLKQVTLDMVANIEDLKEAHILRNNIVHDPDFSLSLEQAKKNVKIYEETFKNLNML